MSDGEIILVFTKNRGCQLLFRMESDFRHMYFPPGFILYVRKNVILMNILLCATV